MSQITTHILDTTRGLPAEGVNISLYQQHVEEWTLITVGVTNKDGRIPDLLKRGVVLEPGVYKMRFETKNYFESQGLVSFYPFVEISFSVNGTGHYHVPLLISPFGYSTYRGS